MQSPDLPLFGCVNKVGLLSSGGVMLSLALKRYYEPLRLPIQPTVISFPYTQLLMFFNIAASGLQHWIVYLPQHADPSTPEDCKGCFRYPIPRTTTFPMCPLGRYLQMSLTRLHPGSLSLRPAALPIGNLRPLVTKTPLP